MSLYPVPQSCSAEIFPALPKLRDKLDFCARTILLESLQLVTPIVAASSVCTAIANHVSSRNIPAARVGLSNHEPGTMPPLLLCARQPSFPSSTDAPEIPELAASAVDTASDQVQDGGRSAKQACDGGMLMPIRTGPRDRWLTRQLSPSPGEPAFSFSSPPADWCGTSIMRRREWSASG